jgi:hypothetical protein
MACSNPDITLRPSPSNQKPNLATCLSCSLLAGQPYHTSDAAIRPSLHCSYLVCSSLQRPRLGASAAPSTPASLCTHPSTAPPHAAVPPRHRPSTTLHCAAVPPSTPAVGRLRPDHIHARTADAPEPDQTAITSSPPRPPRRLRPPEFRHCSRVVHVHQSPPPRATACLLSTLCALRPSPRCTPSRHCSRAVHVQSFTTASGSYREYDASTSYYST